MRLRIPTRVLLFSAAALLVFPLMSFAADDLDERLAHAKTTYSQQGAKAALPEYQALLERYRTAHDRRGEAIVLGLIGNCYKKLGDYPKSLELLNTALRIKRDIHDRSEEGRTLSHLGLVYWEMADYPKAIDDFNQSIAIARELKDQKLEASSLNNLSLVYDEQGDYRRSLQQYNRALELHRSVGYEPGQSDTLGNIGGVYLLLGRYSEATDYYNQALAISERLALKPSETQDLGNLALCQMGLGQLRESVATLDRAIPIAHEAGMAKEEADWQREKGSALVALGEFDKALASYAHARETYRHAGLKRELVELLGDLGQAHLALGDHRSAESDFRQAMALSDEIGHKRGSLDNLLSLAQTQWQVKNFVNAERNANRALAVARTLDDTPAAVRALLLIGSIDRDRVRLDAALVSTEEARKTAEARGLVLLQADALDLLCELRISRQQFTEALALSEKAAQIAVPSGDTDLQWRTQFHRGQALEALGKNDDALASYRSAATVIETVRNGIVEQRFRTGYLQEKEQVYVALVRLLLRMGKPAESFTYSERLREYSYRYQTQPALPERHNSRERELLARIRRLEDLTEQEKERSDREQRAPALSTYSDELLDAQREYAALLDNQAAPGGIGELQPLDLARISKNLPRNSAILEFVIDRQSVIEFVLTRAGLHAQATKIPEADLRAKVDLLRGLIRSGDSEKWRKPSASLREVLIGSIERRGWLEGIDSLLLIPHGILNYLPFAALAEKKDGGKVLVESYELAELPSAMSFLTVNGIRTNAPYSLLAVAPARSRLKFATEEAQEVGKTFGSRSSVVIGKDATETRFKADAGKYDLIHLATHGYFNRVNPAFSGLQLEADNKNDGRLEVHEIVRMKLHARLVTLSACDTGLGGGDFAEIPAGDEFVGLNRAFLEAGSNAVLATLWEVNDHSALIMMRELYTALGDHRGVAALAESQRQMLKDPKYRQPYYWASFVYVGKDFNYSRAIAEKR